ncbi:hypothetical protein GCM10010277_69350 [Streptomyces longisporoflavus]|uniref:hypothetical protein n=1 Tax=Streptomyces longisporoflavus TaxID=28044 RepID=UPI001988A793|nr:hypothetical protein [Streptomyces longisporoflavus]GGV63303.1 hypothetical protein GCM10010277_69350 [Streptomyces longisporoflavus]
MKPTPTEPRSQPGAPWLLLAATLALATCSYLLLNTGPPSPPGPTARPSSPDTPQARQPAGPAASTRTPHTDTSSPPPSPSTAAMLPPRGEGRAADQQIQRLLEEAWPADLPPAQEQQLRRDGAALLRADATGIGRDHFPTVFGNQPDTAVAPAFSRLRIQAAIAREDTRPGRAVVHLVWAGADRGGTYTDNRITDLYFRRTKGDGPWTPLPRP